ncbi:hypothetical protein [Helicobacter winghamensis]|uniref:Uncharacterized protein n=1 Tax=Helicobacter winghamensis TaxID=157268 RepID=A0A2N3PHR4_9HELI|nr:hypothetical protein [Helicobacter winghamensis]EEO25556.1 hypothetical protein HWAG_00348 [Helicobacter winghamensis ATCC BAA-430]PKT78030.1 hypothetical protein BCM34_02105 [Helicobacter winghamensis]PKT78293.1 hypothetical protein BCM32_00855 [Helicobacter winghamensis]PKT78558.1 hypothetical protein BCM35_00395 [Helicobacter winghamensis]PKT80113.1 hypothetical protein BCM31_00280 [Helicobacter winghamensis]
MIDWEALYKLEFVHFKECYLTCDSYCCKNFLGENFKILNQNAVTLALVEGEYNYYKQKGGILNLTTPAKKEEFTLQNGKKFVLYFLSCECAGLCNPHCMRPLLCRIYPYFPIVNAKGEILDFYPASLMDLFFSQKEAHKCTLVREHDAELQTMLRTSLKPLLEIPLFIFIFQVMEILAKSLQKIMHDNVGNLKVDLLDSNNKDLFFKKLEWNLFSRKAWNTSNFNAQITQAYTEIAKNFGEFL